MSELFSSHTVTLVVGLGHSREPNLDGYLHSVASLKFHYTILVYFATVILWKQHILDEIGRCSRLSHALLASFHH